MFADASYSLKSKCSTSHQGCVYWITGLSGAGKTTLAKCLYAHLKQEKPNLVFLDGDKLREVLDDASSHSLEDRFMLAMKYGRLCQLLASQGIDVICATISMFDKCREWNRSNLVNYFEIYIHVSLDVLKQRDQKKLYSRSISGEIAHIVGMDLPFEEPKNPDLIIENDGKKTPQELCDDIFKYLSIKGIK